MASYKARYKPTNSSIVYFTGQYSRSTRAVLSTGTWQTIDRYRMDMQTIYLCSDIDMIYNRDMPSCKFCKSEQVVKNGQRGGMQRYFCKYCSHKFYDNINELPRMRVNRHIILSALDMSYGGLSTRKTAEQLESIFGEKVSQSTIHFWIHKYTKLVSQNFITQAEQQLKLSGKYHHDETEIKVDGSEHFFWETLDEDTRYIVAHLLTKGRTTEDAKKVFQMAKEKQKPIALFTDGSPSYDNAFYAVFDTPFRSSTTEWVRRVGIRARETNNIVERAHSTLKSRLHGMRSLKNEKATGELLDGIMINYNYCRKHQSIKMTPSQAGGIKANRWKQLIESAQVQKTEKEIQTKELVQGAWLTQEEHW